jgi:tRNA (guanosine-2'-O-)-methyltransferase
MYGMVQSLNVSVSAAITIYEALRQRSLKGQYNKSVLSQKEFKKLMDEWIKK